MVRQRLALSPFADNVVFRFAHVTRAILLTRLALIASSLAQTFVHWRTRMLATLPSGNTCLPVTRMFPLKGRPLTHPLDQSSTCPGRSTRTPATLSPLGGPLGCLYPY
jgi:hypothetical protein